MDASNNEDAPVLPKDYTLDCAICLQPFVQPVRLPCSHIFCFLCAKVLQGLKLGFANAFLIFSLQGIALQGQPCALCRADIPIDLLTKPMKFQAKRTPALEDDSNTDK